MTRKRAREEDRGDSPSPSTSEISLLPKRSKAAAAAKFDSGICSEAEAALEGHTVNDKVREEDEDVHDEDDDYTSSSGSSSSFSTSSEAQSDDEDDNENVETNMKLPMNEDIPGTEREKDDDEGEAITYVPGRPRPKIKSIKEIKDSGILSRISSFLPQLQAANVDLERKLAGGKAKDLIMDDAQDDEGQYIEMNLGLGVLKEKRDDSSSESQSVSDSGDEEDNEQEADTTEEAHVMDRLLGIKARVKNDKPGIQEVEDG